MASITLTDVKTFTLIDCYVCGVVFAVTEGFDQRRRNDKQQFWCPNGHPQSYKRSEADRLRDELAQARTREVHLDDQLTAERRAHAATKGKLTKTEKRIAGGVCPCCNRSFVNLGRHMAGQHPDYSKASTAG